MTLAALIILDDERPVTPVLGMSWPEFRMRRAVRAGARHLVVVATRVSRDVVAAIDRLRGEGLSTTLVRSAGEVADLFHPDEAVLLMGGSAVVADARLAELLLHEGPALLCVDAARANAAHELIDAKGHWVGFARIDGAQVRATTATVGDWDLGSTLMRQAIAGRATRIFLADGELLLDAATPGGAIQVSRALAATGNDQWQGWGDRWLVNPLASALVAAVPGALPALAKFGPGMAVACWIAGPLLMLREWSVAALAGFFIGLLVAALSRRASQATGIAARAYRVMPLIRDTSAVVLISAVAWPNLAPTLLGIGLVAFAALVDRLHDSMTESGFSWIADRPGQAATLLVAAAFGQAGMFVGLAICAAHGLATLAFLQNRLSRVLTSLR